MEKITLQPGETIEINGAIINPVILHQLKKFQADENEIIVGFMETISDSICNLLQLSDCGNQETDSEILFLVRGLSNYRGFINDIKAPWSR